MDFGRELSRKQDDIIQTWIAQVRRDSDIESTRNLTSQAILDSLPELIEAIAHRLSQPLSSEIDRLLDHGREHGSVRAKQGYDAEEIIWEYSILRSVILDALEDELLQSQPLPMLRAVRLIEGAIDQAVAFCMKRYTHERLKEVNLLYDELLASNQELDWLVRAEKTNLSHLAHEFKSPLSSIIGYSELFLRQREKMSEVHPEYVERVLLSGRQLLAMINKALAMSSYHAERAAVEPQPVEVCQVVEEVVAALDILAQQKNLPISVACEPISDSVVTDGGRLRQIVTNLISNAIRYTESGQIEIHVRPVKAAAPPTTTCLVPLASSEEMPDGLENSPLARRRAASLAVCAESDEVRGNRIEIQVTDTGLGIDVAEQSRIFEPYYQGKAGQCSADSTGLGLAIAHQMVKLLQGSIHLKSEPEVGSTFTIILPLRYRPAPIEAEPPPL
ncbi:MAG: HAMP domain-containing sensor histidine kinase [Phormidesmis sp.]